VGDVLLEHGAISEHQLAEAVARQRATGQPLGQILVESGIISRLHLASALAEQWSDAPDLIARDSPRTPSVPDLPLPDLLLEPSRAGDDGLLAAEIRSAVQTLTRRLEAIEVQSARAVATEDRVAELRQMVTGLADWASGPELRIAELDASTTTLGDEVQGLATRLDQLIAGLERTITDIEEHTGGVSATLEQLGERLEACASVDEQLALRAAVDAFCARPLVEADTLAAVAAELERRLDTNKGGLEALDSRLGVALMRVDEASNEARSLREVDHRLEVRLVEVDRRLDEVGARENAGAASVDDIGRRVDAVERRLDEVAVSSGSSIALDALTELRAAEAELARRVERLDLETRALADSSPLPALRALEARVDAIASAPPARISAAAPNAAALAELLARIEALEAAPSRAATGPDTAELERLAARIDELDARFGAVDVVDSTREPSPASHPPAGEIDKLRVSVESLWMRMSEFQRSVATVLDPRGVAGKLEAMERRLETVELSSTRGAGHGAGGLGDLGEIARRIEDMEAASSVARETLLTSLERIASSIDWRLQRLERPAEPVAA
jgi:hypothetical protein